MELILARPPDPDRVYFDSVLRHELAKALIPLRLTQPDSQKPPSSESLAGAIRAAIDRGIAGLVIEPSEDAIVIDALYDAVDRGVPVLLLDRPVPAHGGKTIPRIEFTAFDEVGKQIVAALLETDRKLNAAKPGRIVLLHHRSDEPYLVRAYKSLLGPCQAAGKPMEILEFDGEAEQGMAVLKKSLEADPNMDILVADDAVGVYIGFRIHVDRTESGRRGFLLAGYTSNDYRIVTFLDFMFAMGDRSVGSYAAKASRAIRSLMEAKPVEDVVEVPVTFIQSAMIPTPVRKMTPPSVRPGSPKG